MEDIACCDEWQEACLALKKERCSVFVKVNKMQMLSVQNNENMLGEYIPFILDRYTYLDSVKDCFKDPYAGFREDEIPRKRTLTRYSKNNSFMIKINYLDDYDDNKN